MAAQSRRVTVRRRDLEHGNFNLTMHGILGQSQKGNIRLLVLVCFAWKILLLILAAFCPGAGYDTSALISLDASTRRHENFRTLSRPDHLILNLFRWDALYFVKAAERDKLHEQEWAFSWAYSHLLRVTGQCEGHHQPSGTELTMK